MDMVTSAVIFVVGAAATAIILRLLFLFWKRPIKTDIDDQFLKRIANALQ
jgi:hypothetical protein